jgi:hypothetical protein
LVFPYGAGGGTDIIGRPFSGPFSDFLGVPVTISNRAGAAGTVGAAEVARTRPYGISILMVSAASHAPATMMRNLDVNALVSFRPIVQIGTLTTSLMVDPNGPFNTVEDLIEAARANPGGLMKRYDLNAPAFVISFVLATRAEEAFRRSMLLSRNDISIVFNRPVALAFLVIGVSVLPWRAFVSWRGTANGRQPQKTAE